MPATIIPFPQELRPTLPTIVGNVDYLRLRQRLEQIDALLLDSGVEQDFVQCALQGWLSRAQDQPSALEQQKFQLRSRGQNPRLYISVPLALAAAIGLEPGEEVQWELLDRGELHLVRPNAPAALTKARAAQK